MANQINIQVGADIKNFQAGMGQAVDTMKQAGAQMESVSTNVSQNTEKTFKNLQQAYRTTAKDAQVLAMTLGTDSQAFQEAAAKAAMYRDQLDDVQDAINAYHPEKKWQVTADVISGAANVAQGFVGALQLIGVESMNAEKAIATMMALNGVAQAIQSVEALKGAFIALSGSMQLALGAVALLGAAYLIYNSYAAETEETNRKLAESFKTNAENEKKVQDIVLETEKLRIKAMKDGAAKRKAEADLEYKTQLKALINSYQNGEIADLTYQSRKKYLWQIYQNELSKISEKTTDKIAKQQAKIYSVASPQEIDTRRQSGGDLNQMAAGALGEQVQKSIDERWANINAANLKGMDAYKANWQGFVKSMEDISLTLGDVVNSSVAALDGLISGMVNAAMQGQDVGKALISSLLGSMGQFMKQWGAQLILVGIGAEALKKSLATLNGVGAIVAGTLLVAAGAAATSMAANMARNPSSGGGGAGFQSSYSPFSPSMGGGMNNFSFDGVVRGSNLEIVLLNTNQQNRRIR